MQEGWNLQDDVLQVEEGQLRLQKRSRSSSCAWTRECRRDGRSLPHQEHQGRQDGCDTVLPPEQRSEIYGEAHCIRRATEDKANDQIGRNMRRVRRAEAIPPELREDEELQLSLQLRGIYQGRLRPVPQGF